MTTTPIDTPPDRSDAVELQASLPAGTGPIGRVVALSLAIGLVAALLLVAAPFVPVDERSETGALLLGFAIGWAMLAVLSVRLTEQPQRWAAAPAVFMGTGGLLLLVFGSQVHSALDWIWPPGLLALVVWMFVQAHRHLTKSVRRWMIYPVIGILGLTSIGAMTETVLEAADASSYAMPGELVSVDGHLMHLHCTGSGSPTVVLEAGGGDFSSVFAWVAPAVSQETRVCVYDRTGRGWSEQVEGRRDGAQIVDDLNTLLQTGNVTGPYVMAGHSFGGLYTQIFADGHPDEVAGMVLIDTTAPVPPAASTGSDAGGPDSMVSRASALLSASARFGLVRLILTSDYGDLPPDARDEVRALGSTAASARSFIDEFIQGSSSQEQAGRLQDFGDKPLVILTAGTGSAPSWLADQVALTALSTNTAHRVIDGAAHADLVMNREDSMATIQAILDVVSSVRTGQRLTR